MFKKLLLLSFMLSSCTGYVAKVDCPVPKGVQCKSVTNIADMIVEKEEGEDLFMFNTSENCCGKEKTKDAVYIFSDDGKGKYIVFEG